VSVGAASTQLVAADVNRVGLWVGATIANTLTVSTAGTAVLGQGFSITPAMGGLFFGPEHLPMLKGVIRIIADAAGPFTVRFVEYTRGS
jgi:hypothetical protein